jgi:hypothetical protein
MVEEDIVFIYSNNKGSKPEGAAVVAAFVLNWPRFSESHRKLKFSRSAQVPRAS